MFKQDITILNCDTSHTIAGFHKQLLIIICNESGTSIKKLCFKIKIFKKTTTPNI